MNNIDQFMEVGISVNPKGFLTFSKDIEMEHWAKMN